MVYHVGRLISLKSSFQNGVIIPNLQKNVQVDHQSFSLALALIRIGF
ncbi:hypothetical protein [Companilactobacillus sp. FL22-1]